MLILAIDTTAAACSVALTREGDVLIARAREIMEQGQAEALLPMIERLMAQADVAYADLSRIAVTVGPGSFTGVRVGLAAARALGLAASKPVIGVSSLEVLAAAVPAEELNAAERIVAAIDTKRGDTYVQAFDARTRGAVGHSIVLSAVQIADWIGGTRVVVTGDAAHALAAARPDVNVSAADPLPDPAVLARLAAGRQPEPNGPVPLYVLPPKITLAPGGGRLRP